MQNHHFELSLVKEGPTQKPLDENMQLQIKDDSTFIKCDETITIPKIISLYECLTKAVEAEKPIIINAEQVQHIDTASLQLFTSFIITLRFKKIYFAWQRPSKIFTNR